MEYVFFDDGLCDRFMRFLAQRGIAAQKRADAMAGSVVAFDGAPDEAALDAVEAEYEALMEGQMALAFADPALVSHHAVSVQICLSDGRARQVRLPPDIARLLMAHLSAEQLHALVSAIAHGLEQTVDVPLCKARG